jgi:hypothetical protein
MEYEVKITHSESGGTIYYLENDKELSFDWEVAVNGALLFVPSPARWNNFCAENDLPQAQNRRNEVLERVCEEVVRQKTSGTKYEIGDDYISISFG